MSNSSGGGLYCPRFRFQDVGKTNNEVRWKRIPVYQMPKYRERYGNVDICVTMQRFANAMPLIDESAVMPLVFDLDCERNVKVALEDTKKLIEYFTLGWDIHSDSLQVFFPGCKGFGLQIPETILGIKPSNKLHTVNKHIARKLKTSLGLETLDLNIYKSRGLIRLPDSLHSGSGLYKVELYVQELDKDVKWIQKLAKKPRGNLSHDPLGLNEVAAEEYSKWATEILHTFPKKKLRFTYPCLESLYYEGLREYDIRHLATLALAIYLKRDLSLSQHRTLKILLDWSKRNFNFSKETRFEDVERDVRTQIAKVYQVDYRSGCRDGTVALVLQKYCDKSKCHISKSLTGSYQIERQLHDLPI